jgi:hypothetical protein
MLHVSTFPGHHVALHEKKKQVELIIIIVTVFNLFILYVGASIQTIQRPMIHQFVYIIRRCQYPDYTASDGTSIRWVLEAVVG